MLRFVVDLGVSILVAIVFLYIIVSFLEAL